MFFFVRVHQSGLVGQMVLTIVTLPGSAGLTCIQTTNHTNLRLREFMQWIKSRGIKNRVSWVNHKNQNGGAWEDSSLRQWLKISFIGWLTGVRLVMAASSSLK